MDKRKPLNEIETARQHLRSANEARNAGEFGYANLVTQIAQAQALIAIAERLERIANMMADEMTIKSYM